MEFTSFAGVRDSRQKKCMKCNVCIFLFNYMFCYKAINVDRHDLTNL